MAAGSRRLAPRTPLTYNTPKCARTAASITDTAARHPVRTLLARQATAATLPRDGDADADADTSGTSNTS
ncbi:hypothetical protein DIE15_06960 [Burkholderia sp. Bp9031]|nr:hypothetical protein DIE15_06960 [Burkholderia sp. Bp9031]